MSTDFRYALLELRTGRRMTEKRLATALGTSPATLAKWEAGTSQPSPSQRERIEGLLSGTFAAAQNSPFESTGARRLAEPQLFDHESGSMPSLAAEPHGSIIERVTDGPYFLTDRLVTVEELVAKHTAGAPTASSPPTNAMSAGKNTYTYDAHTYHTKVPPQGIAELIQHYLPHGGLILDPFAGSGMTGVAASVLGHDCILNELSPAACFIASRFVSRAAPSSFLEAVELVLRECSDLRSRLYTTTCRECGRTTELLYVVWAYRVICPDCSAEFNLWDVCRSYGRTVREHKILSEFDCPRCGSHLRKAQLRRTQAEPVQVGYMCCGSRQQEQVHPVSDRDRALIASVENDPPLAEGFYPTSPIPGGVNLSQPLRHGLDSVAKFYTPRNLAALSHLWRTIHRFDDAQTAAQLAFAFTSLYRRVTRFSEFRFWGGSGNTARLNVPFIFDEANVFVAFRRKARTIADHLATTARRYAGNTAVLEGSATDLARLPSNSVDLVFTDPPFGANINYSEMNLIWESWLGRQTDATEEAIVNRVQGKDLDAYQRLMSASLAECYRVLRPGHWMLLVFMNSSARVWAALRDAITDSGFVIVKADVFDKRHGTFKHFVSENTAGADLVLHCVKPGRGAPTREERPAMGLEEFLSVVDVTRYLQRYLHVARPTELDLRRLYSEWVAQAIVTEVELMDFSSFRENALKWLDGT